MKTCDNFPMPERGKYDRTLTASARKKAQRRALLVAATSVFASKGVDANVEDIIQAASVSRRTYYEHFDDLADALAAVHDASGKIAARYVDDAIASAPVAHKLERGIRALLELIAQNPGLARVLFREGHAKLAARQEKLRAHFADVLAQTLREVRGRDADRFAVVAVVAGIEAVGTALANGGDLDEATASLVRLAKAAVP